ncbi:MAG: right-handed parallel beta-helix repeat-containing protein [Patescibacteria group bacterium]
MFWLIFRSIIYILIFASIWYGGQFYIAQELSKGLQKTSPNTVFVDGQVTKNNLASANIQNGSFTYPFETIVQAIESAQKNGQRDIIIKSGTYEEILVLPEDITLFGEGEVIIKQNPESLINTITTNNNVNLLNITVSGGKVAVLVPYNTSAKFVNTTFSDASDFGVKMENKERPRAQKDEDGKEIAVYELFDKTDEELENLPLVRFNNVIITKNRDQGMYLRDGHVEIIDSHIIENGEEGIDLHPHMYVKITNTESSNNGESGLETEIYDNIVIIENSTFDNNIKNGIALITSNGVGDITVSNSTITNNKRFGIRCAVHKNKPKKPRPFFQSVITKSNNNISNNEEGDISERCLTF